MGAQSVPDPGPRAVSRRRPEYRLLRDEEDWSVLRNQLTKDDLFDAIKFVPLKWPEASFASLGGELRHQYEWFTNEEWGARTRRTTAATCCSDTCSTQISDWDGSCVSSAS